MKKLFNTTAFIFIIGFAGSWECGNYDFREFLFNTGITLSILFLYHFCRLAVYLIKSPKKIRRVKIS